MRRTTGQRRWTGFGALGASALLALAAAGCGSDATALDKAEERLSETQRGELELVLSASGASSSATGFRFAGTYDYDGPGPYAVLDLEYTRFAGQQEQRARIVSTGRRVFVEADGVTRELTPAEARALRLGDAQADANDGLGIAGWVREPKTREKGGRTVVTGRVEVTDLLLDLAQVMSGITGGPIFDAPDEAARDRVDRLVRSSEIEVVTDSDRNDLRALDAVVDFKARAGEQLRSALGEYSGARLEVRLRHRPLAVPVKVAPPA